MILQGVDKDLALKIYIKARASSKVVAAFAQRQEFDKILIYSKQVNVMKTCYNSLSDTFAAIPGRNPIHSSLLNYTLFLYDTYTLISYWCTTFSAD